MLIGIHNQSHWEVFESCIKAIVNEQIEAKSANYHLNHQAKSDTARNYKVKLITSKKSSLGVCLIVQTITLNHTEQNQQAGSIHSTRGNTRLSLQPWQPFLIFKRYESFSGIGVLK